MSKKDAKAQESALERFRDALYTAKMEAGSVEKLSFITGIPATSLKQYLSGNAKPTLEPLCAMIRGLGATFLNHVIEPLGITGAYDKAPGKLSADSAHAQLAHMAHLLFVIDKMMPLYRPEERRTLEYQLSAIREILNLSGGGL